MLKCQRLFGVAVTLFALLATGCGEKIVEVSGTVTRSGKPVPNVVVNFAPEKGLRSYALTDKDGAFKMVHSSGKNGVVAGSHKVWIELPPAAKSDKEQQQRLESQQSDAEIAQILQKYGSAETTPITMEVKSGKVVEIKVD